MQHIAFDHLIGKSLSFQNDTETERDRGRERERNRERQREEQTERDRDRTFLCEFELPRAQTC